MCRVCGLKVLFKVELKAMRDGTVEVISGRERRRRWGSEEKLRIVAEAEEPGACVRAVAARHDVYPSLLHYWRRQVREGRLVAPGPASFVPVRVMEAARPVAAIPPSGSGQTAGGTIEIVLPDGCRLQVGNGVSLPLLRGVIAALRR
ncbi:MAG: IS66-like element accessory protein TnpA [Minisyncoccia bacterium]